MARQPDQRDVATLTRANPGRSPRGQSDAWATTAGPEGEEPAASSAPVAVPAQVPVPAVNPADGALETPEIGRDIDHYRVLRLLGQGGMGKVLLARDTQLGRLVALKLLRTDRLQALSTEALVEEAKTTARLSHPNVVTVYHMGVWGRSPYMALEYVEGETLRQRMRSAPVTQPEAFRWCLAIADGLQAAHDAGITHCDLKPENVLLPKDGRLRVVDFGIASVLDRYSGKPEDPTERWGLGTPPYMAPEQWLGEPLGPATDVWALGIMLYELLAGQRPFDGPGSDGRPLQLRVLDEATQPRPIQGLAAELEQLLGLMLRREVTERPTAAQVAETLRKTLARQQNRLQGDESPFRGLSAFEERHAAQFFGRSRDVDVLAERLREATVLPVVGPSGAGKSSLVQAGLLQRLREQGPWLVVRMRPGARPLQALAAAVLSAESADWQSDSKGGPAQNLSTPIRSSNASGRPLELPTQLADALQANPALLNLRLHQLAEARRRRVLLFVDQLEEATTHGEEEPVVQAFLTAVAQAADAVDALVRVVFTIRDDLMGRVLAADAMRSALPHLYVVRPLDREALREAATRPAELAGYRWDDPAVLDEMLREVAGQPAAQALVQFVCSAVWERRDRHNKLLRAADYRALGGVAGALASHADAVLDGLPGTDLQLARALLIALVTPDHTRRALPRTQLVAAHGPRAAEVLERLTSARLLVARRLRDGSADDAAVELAHEALIAVWPQLARWLEESSEARAALAELEAAARLWHSRGQSDGELWPTESVRDVQRRLGASVPEASEVAQRFLRESERRAAAQRKRRRQMVLLASAAGVLITVGSLAVAAELARREQTTREQARDLAIAAADMGQFSLQVETFDWEEGTLTSRAVARSALPALTVAIHEPPQTDTALYGPARDARALRLGPVDPQTGIQQVETRSGHAVAVVSGRHRAGEAPCPPSVIPLRHLPGFASRTAAPLLIRLRVPTCAATRARQVDIAAGPYVDGGGDPTPTQVLPFEPERVVDLPAYRIDRHEFAQALMAEWSQMASQTDLPLPDVADIKGQLDFAAPDRPVHSVDWYAAQALCAWLGARLPTVEELAKTGRGGLVVNGALNPLPRRNFPAGVGWAEAAKLAWQDVAKDKQLGAVTDGNGDVSPYGVVNLVGNVSEWTNSWQSKSQVTLFGSSWSNPPELGLWMLGVQNARSPRFFSRDIGLRCAADQ